MPQRKPPRRPRIAASAIETVAKTSKPKVVTGKRGGHELELRHQLGFTRTQFARLLTISERTLADFENGKSPSEATLRSLTAIQRMISALAELVQLASIGPWLTTPNESFGGLKPLEVIERGELDRIWQMIYELRSGVAY